MKKYELILDDKKELLGKTLYRIKALVAIGSIVVPGQIGGYIEKESNLSHFGDAWVYGDAWVFGDARVCGDAWVYGNAQICGDAQIYGNARIFGDALVYGNARVFGDARVYGNAQICGDAQIYGNARVFGNARVYGDAWICGDAWVEKPHQCINIIGTKYSSTLTLTTLQIGCNSLNPLEMENYKYENFKNNVKDEEEFDIWKRLILTAREYQLKMEMDQ